MDAFFALLVLTLLFFLLFRGSRTPPRGWSEGDPDRDPTMGGAPSRPEAESYFNSSSVDGDGDGGGGGD